MVEQAELQHFRTLLLWIEQSHRAALRQVDRSGGMPKKLYDGAIERFKALNLDPIKRVELERFFPHGEVPQLDFLNGGRVLFLRPSEKGGYILPVISLKCDFRREPTAELRLRLAICVLDANQQIRVLGYRFEMPENDGSGRHDFYHVQLIKAFEKGTPGLNGPEAGLDWIPDSQPSFPLDAAGPLTLLLSFLVTLYGLWYLDELRGEDVVPADYLNTLACWKCRPSFWRVRDAAGNHKYFSDSRNLEPIQVQELIAAKLKIPRHEVEVKPVGAKAYSGVQKQDRIANI